MKSGTIIHSPSMECYKVTGLLGSGATANVYQAIRFRDKKPVAIKFFRCQTYSSSALFQRELWAYEEFQDCPFILDILDSDLTAEQPYIVLEFCTYGSARQKLNFLASSPTTTLALATHVAVALEQIHQRGCLYRDLKPDNLLLTNDSVGNMVMKLGDTGLICMPGEFGLFVATRTPAGTLPYMAPELFKFGSQYTRAAEVFTLGVTLHELLTGKRPVAGAIITSGPTEVRTLIQNMIAIEPSVRPTVREVRSEMMCAHQLLAKKEQISLAIFCGGVIAVSLALLLKPGR